MLLGGPGRRAGRREPVSVRHAPVFAAGRFSPPCPRCSTNLAGAFLIGLIAQVAAERGAQSSSAVLFLKVGLCGGFTTFSTLSLETVTLLSDGKSGLAAAYVALSVVLCLLGVVLGQWLGQKLA